MGGKVCVSYDSRGARRLYSFWHIRLLFAYTLGGNFSEGLRRC
jgi:hypothetical protein